MKNIFFRVLAVLFVLTSLTGCQEQLTYPFLMRNPALLRHEVADCQSNNQKTPHEEQDCVVIMNAAVDFNAIVEEQQSDPEKFGQRILDSEVTYAQAKTTLKNAQATRSTLNAQQATPAQIQSAQTALDQAQKNAADKKQELEVLLAVMSMNTPE